MFNELRRVCRDGQFGFNLSKINNEFVLCTYFRLCGSDLALHHLNKSVLVSNKKPRTKLPLIDIPSDFLSLVGITISALGGGAQVCVALLFKKYSSLNEDTMRSLFWAFLLGLFISILLTFFLEEPKWPESVVDCVEVSMHCLASISIWLFALYSLQYISGNTLTVIFSMSVVFSWYLSTPFFHQFCQGKRIGWTL